MGEKLQKKRVGKTQRKREKQREDEEKETVDEETERVSKANPTYKCGLIQTNKLKREKKRIGDF